jgi:leucine dehydrogenase
MSVFSDPAFDDHERVLFCRDAATGLFAIIAVHSTALGPAAGGCRQWGYENENEAVHDVLRLSQGMSYKNAMAGLKFGGGKAVIVKTPDFSGSEALYERFGEFVDSLGGDYITAEDVGMTMDIMQTIANKTRYVTGLPPESGKAGGDPSPKTAFGIYCGIEAAVAARLDRSNLDGLRVAVQGVGHVGYYLCKRLHDAGASLVVSDLDEARVQRACDEFAATSASTDTILFQDVDVVSPCALGAVLDEHSIPRISAPFVAGGANNQLRTPGDGKRLRDAGILYAPDYVINGGGIINVACEYYGDVNDAGVMELVAKIGPRLAGIFEEAASTGEPTNEIADRQAREIIADARR